MMDALWWWGMFWHALRARHVDVEAGYWWYTEVEGRWEVFRDWLWPHSRYLCTDCRRHYKRWWRTVPHPDCDDLPF